MVIEDSVLISDLELEHLFKLSAGFRVRHLYLTYILSEGNSSPVVKNLRLVLDCVEHLSFDVNWR